MTRRRLCLVSRIPGVAGPAGFQRRLAEVLARRVVSTSLSVDNQTERVDAEMVSGNYFTMLGVPPAAGRVCSTPRSTTRSIAAIPWS